MLGIDPGSHFTGYGVVAKDKGGRLIHIRDGRVSLDPATPLPERLLEIYSALNRIIDEERPDSVAVESVFFSKNVKSSILLGEARGIALLCAAKNGLKVFEYAPMSVKQAVSGYGNATKEQVQKMVKALLKTPATSPSDAADALAVAICHLHHYRSLEAVMPEKSSAPSLRLKRLS